MSLITGAAGGGSGVGAAATYRKTTPKDVTNTLVETDLLNGEITIAAGAMGATGTIYAKLMGDFLNNAATEAIPDVKFKLGATTLMFSNSGANSAPTAGATRHPFHMEFIIQNLGAANSQWMSGHYWMGALGAPTTGLGGWLGQSSSNGFSNNFSTSAAAAVDTTVAQVLAVTVTWGTATTTRSFRLQAAVVQVFT